MRILKIIRARQLMGRMATWLETPSPITFDKACDAADTYIRLNTWLERTFDGLMLSEGHAHGPLHAARRLRHMASYWWLVLHPSVVDRLAQLRTDAEYEELCTLDGKMRQAKAALEVCEYLYNHARQIVKDATTGNYRAQHENEPLTLETYQWTKVRRALELTRPATGVMTAKDILV